MSEFFDSEVVREELKEIEKIQKEMFGKMMEVPFYTKEQKKEHLKSMKEFLEKQKLFVFRLSLSDDPEAIEMKEKIIESAEFLGFDKKEGFDGFFKTLERTIDSLEQTLDD